MLTTSFKVQFVLALSGQQTCKKMLHFGFSR